MPLVPFAQLPDHARVWVFAAAEPLTGAAADKLLSGAREFGAAWTAHGQPVVGGFDWRFDRFLIVAADERATGVSGCSIDSLFRTLKDVEREVGATLVDASPVWFRDSNAAVRSVSRSTFREMARRGEVQEDTTVFDNTVATLGALRAGEWERPLRASWHGKAFPATG
ncbi:MAG: hypothetical protein GEU90_05630 [Gemmatimonas sp.]|nr:hypothetical protein [Gemmatimonas sp.]